MVRKIIPFLTLIFCASWSQSSFGFIKDLYLGLGNVTEYPLKVQVNDSGDTENYNTNFTLLGGAQIDLWHELRVQPEVGLIFSEHFRHASITRYSYYLLAPLTYTFFDQFSFRLGPGLYMTYLSSDGGTEPLPNGAGTSDFFLPPESSTSRNFILDIGVEFRPFKHFSAKFDTYLFNLSNSEKRVIAYSFNLNFYFTDILFSNSSNNKRRPIKRSLKKRRSKKNSQG